jgi:hypothetical protein
MKKLLANRWQTPDGTILWSKHRHDYVEHWDKNGEYYAIDGGASTDSAYTRKSINEKEMKNLCIYSNGTFELEREWVLWGRLYDEILKLNIPNSYRRLMEEEIIYREDQILEHYGK